MIARSWLHAQLQRVLQHTDHRHRLVIIVGQSGSGKSTICRQLQVHHQLAALHYCDRFDRSSIESATIIRSIADQLAHRLSGFQSTPHNAADVLHDWQSALHRMIVRPLVDICDDQQQPMFILIDGIDEDMDVVPNCIDVVTALVDRLPDWMSLVVTCTTMVIDRLLNDQHLIIQLDDMRQSCVTADLQQLILDRIDGRLALHVDPNAADSLARLHILCAGNWCYIELVLGAIERRQINVDDVATLPVGIDALYLW
jgi:energy-coupling factor transporter ATP-binding protein EcfA2